MPNCPSEHEEQVALFDWARLMEGRYPVLKLMFAVPNGEKRQIQVAKRLKAEGVKPGVQDVILPVPRAFDGCLRYGLFIEMKRLEDWEWTDEQRWWYDQLSLQGYLCALCEGCADAISLIKRYLQID